MPQLCGCLHSVEPERPTSQTPAYPGAGSMHRADSPSQPPRYDSVDSGYTPVVPLPRYTPRPVSMHEKSIGNTFHEQQQQQPPNEKNPHHFEEPDAPLQAHSTGGSSTVTVTATMDDASSAYSFPSSFGHTSTETRDTPPPPYSSCGGSLYSRSRASSMRSSRHDRSDSLTNNYHASPNNHQQQQTGSDFVPATTAIIAPPPMAHIGNNSSFSTFAPSMTYTSLASRQAGSPNQRRFSWESR